MNGHIRRIEKLERAQRRANGSGFVAILDAMNGNGNDARLAEFAHDPVWGPVARMLLAERAAHSETVKAPAP